MQGGFEPRMGVSWTGDGGRDIYALVMGADDEGLEMFQVFPVVDGVRCYDEGGAKWATDRDNVKLKSAPPPFSFLLIKSGADQCYAYAPKDAPIRMGWDDVSGFGVQVVNGGDKISEDDLREVLDHPWRDEKEKYRPVCKELSATERMMRRIAQADAILPGSSGHGGYGLGE